MITGSKARHVQSSFDRAKIQICGVFSAGPWVEGQEGSVLLVTLFVRTLNVRYVKVKSGFGHCETPGLF